MTDSPVDMCVPGFGHGLGEALLIEWVAGVGDRVERGDVVAVVETDKASTEIVAERDGRVTAHSATAGTILKSGDVLYQLAADQPPLAPRSTDPVT
ncbi:lipoyl domain-containing protein [Streptomyces sp. NBC_00343]|uniref:lipoyl domain-containing protein n=1 Tax=Streptomyces sp. NBC_00343 TaxID=2975719 RepID=UPI002E297F2D|nr:lipoyl domain-containing protein [Streptomyces sp. NBC_00343]